MSSASPQVVPPPPCRRLTSNQWSDMTRGLPTDPAARLRALARCARELLDATGGLTTAAQPHGGGGACDPSSGVPRLLRAALSATQPLLLLLVNGALLIGDGRQGVEGLGALLAGCAVAHAGFEQARLA